MEKSIESIIKQGFESILDTFSIDIVLFDLNHTYLYVNSIAIADLEIRKWIIGKDDFDYCKLKGIDDSLAKKRRKYFNTVLKTKSDIEWIDKKLKKNGDTQYLLRKFHPLIENDQIKYVMAYGVDITELKASEKIAEKSKLKYERLIQNMSDGLLVDATDSFGTVLYCNQKFREIFGFEEDDVKNLKIKDYIAPEYHKELQDRHNKRIKGEKVSSTFECQGVRKDGKNIWLEIRVTPIIEKGIIKGTQSLITDITEKKKKDFQLEKLNNEIIETEEVERARIAYELHDGVSQKLVAAKMYLNISNSENDIKNSKQLIKSTILMLDSTIQEVRAISNNLAPKDLLDYGLIVATNKLIEQVRNQKKINIKFNYPIEFEHLSLSKHIDFNIYRIIQECLNNTIKHAFASEIEINFKCDDTSRLLIFFSNNGVKIDNHIIEKPSCFVAIKRRVNALKGKFQIHKNIDKEVVLKCIIPLK